MIYFLVNNDYQLVDARNHLARLRVCGQAVKLIEVPHTLNTQDRGEGFDEVFTIRSPLTSHGWLAAWPRYFAVAREVERRLNPAPGDTLFFYTEYELVNHFVTLLFKRKGARTVLLEDGGFGTYLPFSISETEPLSIKEKVIAWMTRRMPGLSRTRFHKVNDEVFPWLPDHAIDALATYRSVAIVRAIPVVVMAQPERARIEPIIGKVIFMNAPMYEFYQTDDQYLSGLDRILQALTAGFTQVSFKFHPREQEVWTSRIRKLLNDRHPTVRVIEERQGIEHLLAQERPEVLASYFSTTLLNLGNSGVQPLYLYHLIGELAAQKFFRRASDLLTQWKYRFVKSFPDARTGYRSGLDELETPPGSTICNLLADQS